MHPSPPWLITLQEGSYKVLILGARGDRNILRYPSKVGFRGDKTGLPWDLHAVSWKPSGAGCLEGKEAVAHCWRQRDSTCQPFMSILIGDSIVRGLRHSTYNIPSAVTVVSIGGATLQKKQHNLVSSLPRRNITAIILHGGTNNINRLSCPEQSQMACFNREWSRLSAFVRRIQLSLNLAVIVSGIMYTQSEVVNARVDYANDVLRNTCTLNRWRFISHEDISTTHLRDNVHPNTSGNMIFFRSLEEFLM